MLRHFCPRAGKLEEQKLRQKSLYNTRKLPNFCLKAGNLEECKPTLTSLYNRVCKYVAPVKGPDMVKGLSASKHDYIVTNN